MRRFAIAALFAALLPGGCGPGTFGGASSRPPAPLPISSPNGEPLGYAGDRARCEALLTDWLAGADADRNGSLSLAELEADAQRWFVRADTDGDGFISVTELSALRQSLEPRSEQRPEPRRSRFEVETPREPDPVMAADLNLDFRVSREEFRALTARRYAALTRRGPADREAVVADCEKKRFR